MKLSNKLLIFLFAASLISISLISTIAYRIAKSEAEKRIESQLETVAERQLKRVNAYIQDNRQEITTLSTMVELRLSLFDFLDKKSTSSARTIHNILAQRRKDLDFQHLHIVSVEGSVLISTNRNLEGLPFAYMEIVSSAENGSTIALMKNPEPSLFLVDTIKVGERSIGYVVIESGTEELVSIVRDYTNLGETGETELVEDASDGYTFITPLRFDSTASLSRKINSTDTTSPIFVGSLQKNSYVQEGVDYRGKHVSAATRYIDLPGWVMVVKMDRAEAFASIDDLWMSLVLISLGTLVYITLVAFFFARLITAPIVKLTQFAQKISEGDFEERITIDSSDEIGVLATSFNKMGEQLRLAFNSLEAKVSERTKELEQKTKELTERDRDLLLKNTDLGRFNNMAVNRELKMIEMKAEMAEMQKKLDANAAK